MKILGIDVGGSGVKGAIVETETGEMLTERYRIPTPKPSTPNNLANTINDLVEHFDYQGPVGCCFPAVMIDGKPMTASNIHKSCIGTPLDKLFEEKTGNPFVIYNDADLAGLAEMRLGAGKELKGLVVMITIGTGLGSGVFYNGVLIPNFELGRIFGKDGQPIEIYASDKARKANDLSWEEWGQRFDFFLNYVKQTIWPDHFILGGGASKKYELFKNQLTLDIPVKIAYFKNNAGIIGAALEVKHTLNK